MDNRQEKPIKRNKNEDLCTNFNIFVDFMAKKAHKENVLKEKNISFLVQSREERPMSDYEIISLFLQIVSMMISLTAVIIALR